MNEEPRSNAEMLELVRKRAAVIRTVRHRRRVLVVRSIALVAVTAVAIVVLRRPDHSPVVEPAPVATPESSTAETSTPSTATSLPATTTSPPATTTTTSPAADLLVLEPTGTNGGLYGLRLSQTSVVSTPLTGRAGQVVLRFELQVDFDTGGRGGTITSADSTDDGQFGVTLGCRQPACTFAPGAVAPAVTTDVIVDTTGAAAAEGIHNVPMSLNFDDGTAFAFSVKLAVNRLPGPDVSRQIAESTGPPAEVQRVVGVGNFSYHLTSAFGSIWVVGKSSETVTRLDAETGQIEATIRLSAGQTNRVTATDAAVYVSGNPVTRIDPTDNSTSTIELPSHSLAIIGDHDRVWATGFRSAVSRIDADGTVASLAVPANQWVDLAISHGLVWAVSQVREQGRVVAFDGETGEVRYDIAVVEGQPISAPVRLVADERSVVVGIDTSGLGGRTGEIVVIDPGNGSITARVPLDSRPEGIALTDRHIWTSSAVLDRETLAVTSMFLGFSITLGPDGSIWGTRSSPDAASGVDVGQAIRYAPGDFAG